MNREIKFRGKSKIDGSWVFGLLSYAHQENQYYIGVTELLIPVIPETVGQFTGLNDKYGQDIYEGDVVKWWSGTYSVEGLPDNVKKQADQTLREWLKTRDRNYDYESNGWYKQMNEGIVLFYGASFSIHNESDIAYHLKNSTYNLTSHYGVLQMSKQYEITGNIHENGND